MLRIKTLAAVRQLVRPGEKVCAAVSGGPDSTALLLLLSELKDELGISLSAVHINHGLRGDESEGDARFCRDLCRRLSVPLHERRVHVERYRAAAGGSTQSAARELRYLVFSRFAAAGLADKIATAHTGDDAAETLLLNLIRGTGPRGLSGIPAARGGIIVRPLLETAKEELLRYLEEKGQPFRADSSNRSEKYLRNRVRLSLIPALEREYNPSLRETLQRTAGIMAEMDAYVAAEAAAALKGMGQKTRRGGFRIETARFAALHPALQYALLRLAVESVRKGLEGISFQNIETLRGLALSGGPGGETSFRGICARVGHGWFHLEKRGFSVPPFQFPFSTEGRTGIPGLGCAVEAAIVDARPASFDPACETVWCDADAIPANACLRNRRNGDVFTPLGAPGARKLKNFFIDAKIPRWERDAVPLLASENRVLWIAGVRLSDDVKISPATRRILKLARVAG